MQNKRFSSISASSAAFTERVASDAAALKLLEVAGFRPVVKPGASALSAAAAIQSYDLVHTNAAILSLVEQVCLSLCLAVNAALR